MKEKIEHINVRRGMTVNEIVMQMSKSGVFGAGRIAEAADIMEAMM